MKDLKTYQRIFLIALFIRLLLMPFLFHPDIKIQYYHVNFLKNGIFNIDNYNESEKSDLGYKDNVNYPPLRNYLLGSYSLLTQPLMGQSFQEWLNDWGENNFTNPNIFRHLFILKIPYLLLDVGIALLILKFVEDKKKKLALMIWLFNPITLYIIYGLSNFDVIPVFLTLLSLFFYKSKQYTKSGLALGTGIAVNLYPLILLPFFVIPLLKSRDLKSIFQFTLSSLGVFLLTIIFLSNDLLSISNRGLITKILGLNIPLVNLTAIPVFGIFYTILLLTAVFTKYTWERLTLFLLSSLFLVTSVTTFHPQWLLWSLPFFVIFASIKPKLLIYFIPVLIGFVNSIFIFEDRFLTLGIISPILPNIYDVGFLEQTFFSVFDKNWIIFYAKIFVAFGTFMIVGSLFKLLWKKST